MTRFRGETTHSLPVAVTKIPVIYWRNGLPRPVVLKKPGDEYRHDDGVRKHGDPRRNLF